jgi:hypothetical protein
VRQSQALIWRELYRLRDYRFHRFTHDFIIRLAFELSVPKTFHALKVPLYGRPGNDIALAERKKSAGPGTLTPENRRAKSGIRCTASLAEERIETQVQNADQNAHDLANPSF